MSLMLSLNNALSGLKVNQSALTTLSHNIANANTPGYSRQVVKQESQYIEGTGVGVQISDVTRVVDEYLQRATLVQNSSTEGASITSTYQQRLQQYLGQPGAGNSLDSTVSNFFSTAQSFAQSPELGSYRTSIVNSGKALAGAISGLARNVHELRYQADQDISNAVRSVNQELKKLHDINQKIAGVAATGGTPNDLLDARDASIRTISGYLDVSVQYKSTGAINLSTGTGTTLLDDSLHQLQYSPAASADSFTGNTPVNPINVYTADDAGNLQGNPVAIVSGGTTGNITTTLRAGKIKSLLDVRDVAYVNVLSQLDTLAAKVRDQVNKVHNAGSSFPPPTSLTGTRLVQASSRSDWSGSVQIAVLQANGQPVDSGFSNETTGLRPLTLDFSSLNSGYGNGSPTVETIIDEINNYFQPSTKAGLGPLNNIRLTSNAADIPGASNQLSLDFDLDNLTGHDADFFVTGMTVKDDHGVDITSTSTTQPFASLAGAGTYQTTNGSTTVTITTTAAHGFSNGQRIYLTPPGAAVNGVPAAELGGYFTISNVTANTFDVTVTTPATSTGAGASAGEVAFPRYDIAAAGTTSRTKDQGLITASVAGNPTSSFYDVTVNVGTQDSDGNLSTGTITYRVPVDNGDNLNRRFGPSSVTGSASLTPPNTSQPFARAVLVDANGNELTQTNGSYGEQEGYLKIVGGPGGDYRIAINQLSSSENGLPNGNPPRDGTGWGFSHYFGLNNFFASNAPITSGDTLAGSALNLRVEDRLLNNQSLVTTAGLTRNNQPTDPNANPIYTYSLFSGGDDVVQQMAGLGSATQTFGATGGLPDISQTMTGFAGQMLGYNGAVAASAQSNAENSKALLDGFNARIQQVSGVNLDEELANTVIYQNAYSASARIVTVANQLFGDLLSVFQ